MGARGAERRGPLCARARRSGLTVVVIIALVALIALVLIVALVALIALVLIVALVALVALVMSDTPTFGGELTCVYIGAQVKSPPHQCLLR